MKKKGAPQKNKNAKKTPGEYKQYYPIRFFGRRWNYATGLAIDLYLQNIEKSQWQWLDEYLLPHLPTIEIQNPTEQHPFTFAISPETFVLLESAGLHSEALKKLTILE